MAAYESMVLLSLLFVKKYANQKADIFLQNGKETAQFEKQKTTLSGGFRFAIVHRLCCPHTLRIPQGRGSVRGKPLRVSLFAGGHFCAAKVQLQKEETHECVSLLFGAAGRIRTADLILTNYRKAIAACCWLLCLFACIPLFPMVAGFFLLCLAVFYYSLKVLGF